MELSDFMMTPAHLPSKGSEEAVGMVCFLWGLILCAAETAINTQPFQIQDERGWLLKQAESAVGGQKLNEKGGLVSLG